MTLVSHKTAQKLKNIDLDETLSIRIKTDNLFQADDISKNLIENLNRDDLIFRPGNQLMGHYLKQLNLKNY